MEIKYLVPKDAIKNYEESINSLPQPPDFSSLKEPAEAFQVLSLESLTGEILRRKDLSQWQKAELLSKNLERYLSLKRNLIPDQPPPQAPLVVPDSNPTTSTPQQVPSPVSPPKRRGRRKETAVTRTYSFRQNRPTARSLAESPVRKPKKIKRNNKLQSGTGWLHL
jgi:hypothetical protein